MEIGNIESIHPVTPFQEAMLARERENRAGEPLYGLCLSALRGRLDCALFERVWQTIIESHAILRTSFAWKRGGALRQIVHKELKLFVHHHDWCGIDSSQQQSRLKAHFASEAGHGFDPSEAPLMRITLVRISEEEYRLALSYHPLALDQQSALLLIEEFFALYENGGRPSDGRAKVSPFLKAYVGWVEQQDFTDAQDYWSKALEGYKSGGGLRAPVASEGADRKLSEITTRRLNLSPSTAAALLSLAGSERLDSDSVLIAAWALLLHRYTGEEGIGTGLSLSARPGHLDGAERMIGPLTSCLPLPLKVSPAMTALELIKDVDAGLKRVRQYSYCSEHQLREWGGLDASQDLYASAVRVGAGSISLPRNLHGETFEIDNIDICGPGQITTLEGSLDGEPYLQLSVGERGIDSEGALRTLRHLETLLTGIAEDAQRTLSALPLLTQAEFRQLTVEFSGETEACRPLFFHQLFEEQVKRSPDSIALTYEETCLTYDELNGRANQLAHRLRALGVAPEGKVGIYLNRSPELIVGLLAILKAGGAYVPLDPTYPFERILMIFEDAQPSILLTEEGLADRLPVTWAHVICLDSDREEIERERDDDPVMIVEPENLAYVMYTSGSSGTPKGVMVEHRGLGNLAMAQVHALGVTSRSHVLQFASLNFDASIWEIMMAFSVGAALHLGTRDTLMPGPGLVDALRARGITTVTLPPSFLAVLPAEELKSLSTVISAGEACLQEIAARWSAGRRFINAYGPTEVTVCATMADCNDPGERPGIGRPIKNVTVFLLDRYHQPAPVGIPGELCVGGAGLARGYLNRPVLTASRFIPDPFSDSPGERLYMTGDHASYRPGGEIDFAGRIDHQIKVHGVRIEAGEIESVLARHPAVKHAVAAARPGPTGTSQLVAYIVPDQEFISDSDDSGQVGRGGLPVKSLRAHLKKYFPDYMIPTEFVLLRDLPLSPNGKVDRAALPSPEQARPEIEEAYAAPRTPTEEALAMIWSKVLAVEQVGIHDNFFELRGHSLLATQVLSHVRETFQVELPLRNLFESPTVAGLAQLIEMARWADSGSDLTEESADVELGEI